MIDPPAAAASAFDVQSASAAFYASQAYRYVRGHFPCSWRGDFPDGKLVIY